MAAADVPPVVARIVADLLELPGVGLVYDHDVWDRDDLAPLIVTNIAGANVVRCWWLTGPTLEATYRTNLGDGHLERRWTYQLHGIAGDPDGDGTGVNVLRNLGLQVTDRLDRDPTFGETVFRKPVPAGWTTPPGMVLLADAMWVAYLVITVPVITLTRPI